MEFFPQHRAKISIYLDNPSKDHLGDLAPGSFVPRVGDTLYLKNEGQIFVKVIKVVLGVRTNNEITQIDVICSNPDNVNG